VVELATLDGARRRERRATTTLPERLRSALTARGWVRRPEPRVRFGQPVLPGTSALNAGDRTVAAGRSAAAAHHSGRDDPFARQLGRPWRG